MIGTAALGFLYPPRCGLCRLLGPHPICAECRAEFGPPKDFELPDGIAARVCAYEYTGRAAQAVQRLKYERATALAAPMAEAIRTAVDAAPIAYDAVVPVPIHWFRRSGRGFNQSELLAETFGDVRPNLLRRVRYTRPQVGLAPTDRRTNLAGAFRASPEVAGMAILLVDDVVTTGSTARECARALREAGAYWVGIAAFAG